MSEWDDFRDTVCNSVGAEIVAQQLHGRQKWGGDPHNLAHDDAHTLSDWIDMIAQHCERARVATPLEARQELVKIAGLAKSGVEAFDRKAMNA